MLDPNKPSGLISNTSSVVFITAKISYIRFFYRSAHTWFPYIYSHYKLKYFNNLIENFYPFFAELVRAAKVAKMKLKLFSNMAESLPPIF